MKRYMIYCSVGTGGMFLSSVVAQMLGYDVKSIFSATGNAHNMGQGNWNSIDSCVCVIGDFWNLNYRPGQLIYYSHTFNKDFRQTDSDVKIIKIQAQPIDYRKVTELYVKKAWPDIWTEEEYAKWASPNYPPYSQNNILESQLVCNDLINDFEITTVKKWHDENVNFIADYYIDFKTVMGQNNLNLAEVLSDIVSIPADQVIQDYIKNYQKLNQELYFNET